MKHIFDVELAEEIGVNAAIILENLSFWCKKNKANDKHEYEGSTWTYNSVKAFGKLFPYLTRSSINNALKTLEDLGYIITGNFNKIAYDRTKWYSVTEKGMSKIEKCIYQKQEMDLLETGKGLVKNRKPIPDINPDIKAVVNNISLSEDEKELSPEEIKNNKTASRLSNILKDILSVEGKITKGTRTNTWSDSFRKLITIDDIPPARIRKMLNWYEDHVGEEMVPQCYSAKSFREKFIRLEDAMKRDTGQNKKSKPKTRLGGAEVIPRKYDDYDYQEYNADTGELTFHKGGK